MRHPNVAHIPDISRRRFTVNSPTKESKLEPKAPPFGGVKIPRVIPPLGLKVGMIEMVARKFKSIARQRDAIRIARSWSVHSEQHRGNETRRHRGDSTPHESPRSGQGASRSWRDKEPTESLQRKQSKAR